MSWLRKMLFTDLLQGMKVTFRNQHPKQIIPSSILCSGRRSPSAFAEPRA